MAFQKITEQESLYKDLDKKPVRELLEDINREDRKVAEAVGKEIPKMYTFHNVENGWYLLLDVPAEVARRIAAHKDKTTAH